MMLFRLIKYAIISLALLAPTANAEPVDEGTARFDRASLIIKDMDSSVAFWRDVMRFKLVYGPVKLPASDNKYLGWTKDTVVHFAGFKSPDGAGIGLLEVKQDGFPALDLEKNPTGYGGVIFVHVESDIEALNRRAIAADAVLKPLGLSSTGRSKQMYLKSPSGHVLEVYQVLPKKED